MCWGVTGRVRASRSKERSDGKDTVVAALLHEDDAGDFFRIINLLPVPPRQRDVCHRMIHLVPHNPVRLWTGTARYRTRQSDTACSSWLPQKTGTARYHTIQSNTARFSLVPQKLIRYRTAQPSASRLALPWLENYSTPQQPA